MSNDDPPAPPNPEAENVEGHELSNSIQVSLEKKPGFYARIGERMLTGLPGKPKFDEVVIAGLGMATKTAIGAASILEKSNTAVIKSIQTSYPTSTRDKRRVAKIAITLVRHPDAPTVTASAEPVKTQPAPVEA